MIQNEYRQVGKNYKNINDFSLKKLEHSTKSHFFKHKNIVRYFNTKILKLNKFERASNDTYLKSDNITTALNNSQSLLNSYIKYSIDNESLNFFAEVEAYEDLSREKNSDKYQFIFSFIVKITDTKGYLKVTIYSIKVQIKKETNINEGYLINNLEYHSNIKISKNGLNDFSLFLKMHQKRKNSETYSNDLKSDNYFSSILQVLCKKKFIINIKVIFHLKHL